jgi:hypothetical protein
MSGTCFIPVLEQDSVYSEEDPAFYLISVKSQNKLKKYWIRKEDYLVTKYIQYDEKNNIYLIVEYSNYFKTYNSAYAKKIVIQRPSKKEKMSLFLTGILLNQNNLNFNLEMPSGYRKIKWF